MAYASPNLSPSVGQGPLNCTQQPDSGSDLDPRCLRSQNPYEKEGASLRVIFYLTKKNAWIWVSGVGVVALTGIGILVPADQWGSAPWRWIILSLMLVALVGLTVVFAMQSKEDQERDEREKRRDAAQDTLMTQVAQQAARGEEKSQSTMQDTQTTLSALTPGVNFNFDDYFRLAHVSQLTEQTAKDIKILVGQQHPNDREETLARFIGIGFWGYMHEVMWPYIFRSQILALTELNAHGGIMPLGGIRMYYDKATIDHPSTYAQYSFDQWMSFMLAQSLWLKRPGDAIEITLRGRDFLKFMTHWGWTADMKRN